MDTDLNRLRAIAAGAWRKLVDRSRDAGRHQYARLRRSLLPRVTFIGITGSAGKTTAKELTAAILSSYANCAKSRGSANENCSVEWAVMSTTRSHEFSVIEMSASKPGYLDRSIRAARPRIAVLTLIAREHYSAFGSNEAIAAEKGKLISSLPADGVAVLNRDDPHVRAIGERFDGRIVWVGQDEGATIRLLESRSRWPEPLTLRVQFADQTYEVPTRLHGVHLTNPLLCALGVAVAVNMPFADAIAAVTVEEPSHGRMQIVRSDDGVVFVRDDWKAPEWSFAAPLELMRDATAKRKVVVIGTISDSPKSPSRRYSSAAKRALQVADVVVLVGVDARGALKLDAKAHAASLHAFPRIGDAAAFLREELRAGDLVLLKGTNLQDHLIRFVHDRQRRVHCWVAGCRRLEFCDGCEMLYGPRRGLEQAAIDNKQAIGTSESGTGLVIIGLGNPHPRHRNTPHNIGHRLVDALARDCGGATWKEHPEGLVCVIDMEALRHTLIKPAADMNLTGPVVRRFLERTGRSAADCVIVHDDFDLELGDARGKDSGGDGGHKGVRSIIDALCTDRVHRIRVGVRKKGDARKAIEAVLDPFSPTDARIIASGLDKAQALVRSNAKKRAALMETADDSAYVP